MGSRDAMMPAASSTRLIPALDNVSPSGGLAPWDDHRLVGWLPRGQVWLPREHPPPRDDPPEPHVPDRGTGEVLVGRAVVRVAMVVEKMHLAMAALAQPDERAVGLVALGVPVAEV